MPKAKPIEEGCNCVLVPKKVAMALGSLLALMHLGWAILVASGTGQMFWDWIMNLHMISMPVVIGPFNIFSTIGLLVVTFISGYVMGWVFAFVWNYFQNCKCKCKWC